MQHLEKLYLTIIVQLLNRFRVYKNMINYHPKLTLKAFEMFLKMY